MDDGFKIMIDFDLNMLKIKGIYIIYLNVVDVDGNKVKIIDVSFIVEEKVMLLILLILDDGGNNMNNGSNGINDRNVNIMVNFIK